MDRPERATPIFRPSQIFAIPLSRPGGVDHVFQLFDEDAYMVIHRCRPDVLKRSENASSYHKT
jgi:hypothetical protein